MRWAMIKALTGATAADMDKIRSSGLSACFCTDAANAGLSVPEILQLGGTGVSVSGFISIRHGLMDDKSFNGPGIDSGPQM